MKRLLLVAGLIFSVPSWASEWRLLDPDVFAIEAYRNKAVHDPYLVPIDKGLGYGGNFQMDFSIATYRGLGLRMENLLHLDQSLEGGQVRHAGWQYGLYVSILTRPGTETPMVELLYQHHSRHVLEAERPGVHFPVYDRYGVRFVILDRRK